MKKDLSVIMCVYNTAKYLTKSIESVLSQTYENYEFIIVDDGSTDNSYDIIQKYKKNKRIKIIQNEKNMGVSYCRNLALKQSNGAYISFLDSDDYISDNYLEEMMKNIELKNCDMAICDINVIYTDDNNRIERIPACLGKVNVYNVINNGLAASACNKIFKKELILQYHFSEGKINEDLAVVLPAIVNSTKITYVNNVFYYYIQRKGSIQNSQFSDKKFDIFYTTNLTLQRIKNCENFKLISQAIIFNQLITLLIFSLANEKNFFKRLYFIKQYSQLINQYDVKKNVAFEQFLASKGIKHQIYYKSLVYLCYYKFSFLACSLISIYNNYKKVFIRKVINDKNININELERLAKIQSKRKKNKRTISVIIPNYNYSRFLYQRLYSVLLQQVKLGEIIILDDYSSDNSREIIDQLVTKLSKYIDIKSIYNTSNSGSAFKQWKLGFEKSKNDFVWIAEADDYCNKKFLKKLTKFFKYDNVSLIYSDTAFIDLKGKIILKSVKSQIDIMRTGHWRKDYIIDGEKEFNKYAFLNCTISNVSSCLIKRDDYNDILESAGRFKQAGDWLFYSYLMQKGKICFCRKVLNYYRVHGNNVSSIFSKKKHMEEIYKIHHYFDRNYHLNKFQKEQIKKRYDYLIHVWKLN